MNFNPKQKTANLLSLCFKAGKAAKGFDSTCEAIKNDKAFCVLTASDASEKTVKEILYFCEKHNIPLLKTELSKAETGSLCGKETAVVAVTDKGFADGFLKIFNSLSQ